VCHHRGHRTYEWQESERCHERGICYERREERKRDPSHFEKNLALRIMSDFIELGHAHGQTNFKYKAEDMTEMRITAGTLDHYLIQDRKREGGDTVAFRQRLGVGSRIIKDILHRKTERALPTVLALVEPILSVFFSFP
jgi:hypothetical protein